MESERATYLGVRHALDTLPGHSMKQFFYK